MPLVGSLLTSNAYQSPGIVFGDAGTDSHCRFGRLSTGIGRACFWRGFRPDCAWSARDIELVALGCWRQRTKEPRLEGVSEVGPLEVTQDGWWYGYVAPKEAIRRACFIRRGGAEEDRTPDLRIANATLSQLSYRPFDGKANDGMEYVRPSRARILALVLARRYGRIPRPGPAHASPWPPGGSR